MKTLLLVKCRNVFPEMLALLAALVSFLSVSCTNSRRLSSVIRSKSSPGLELSESMIYRCADSTDAPFRAPDTLFVTDNEGNRFSLMRTSVDETGTLVASDRIRPAYVSARFRNIAERRGMIEISFDVNVPPEMISTSWQLRIVPSMSLMGDTVPLDCLLLTGEDFRQRQLRGYQQYERFVSSLISDSTAFVNRHQLEIFLERNMPQIAAFRTDSSYVSDESFQSSLGVSLPEAVSHYTRRMLKWINGYRCSLDDKMRSRYLKEPIMTSGVRLDTVLGKNDGYFIYRYVQSVATRPGLRRIDVSLDSDIHSDGKLLYRAPAAEALTFYVSSLSGFAELGDRYVAKLVERRVREDRSYYLNFAQGRSDFDETDPANANCVRMIKDKLKSLYADDRLELDSITVSASASPEGASTMNMRLSERRSAYTCSFFGRYMDAYRDSLAEASGYYGTLSGVDDELKLSSFASIGFISRGAGEDWVRLDNLVASDTLLSDADKCGYTELRSIANPDRREAELKTMPFYSDVMDRLYPELRTVKFAFHLHRRGQVKDTVWAAVVDTNYNVGVKALISRDYEKALQILAPYDDFNSALAYMALERNVSARTILERCPRTPKVLYLLSVVQSRLGDVEKAVSNYLEACRLDASYVHRGNLDPEIAALKREYGIEMLYEE